MLISDVNLYLSSVSTTPELEAALTVWTKHTIPNYVEHCQLKSDEEPTTLGTRLQAFCKVHFHIFDHMTTDQHRKLYWKGRETYHPRLILVKIWVYIFLVTYVVSMSITDYYMVQEEAIVRGVSDSLDRMTPQSLTPKWLSPRENDSLSNDCLAEHKPP